MGTKVKIGCRYERPWFEERRSDGQYRWFRGPVSTDEVRLQDALLRPSGRRRVVLLVLATVFAIALWGATHV